MGSNQSSASSTSLSSIVNSAITTHTQSTRDSLQQRLQMSQTQVIKVGDINMTDNCTFSANQKMTGELSATLQTLHNMSSDTRTAISADIAQALETRLTQVNEGLNIGQSNDASSASYTRSSIENAIRNTQEQMSETFMDMGAVANQEQEITLGNIQCSGSGSIELNQEMAMSLFSDQVAKNMFSSTASNNAVASSSQTISTAIEQHNKGLDLSASCAASCIAIVMLSLIGGMTSTKLYEDTPDEAKIILAETGSAAIKAKTGTMGGSRKGRKNLKSDSIEHLIKYGGLGAVYSGLGGTLIGCVCSSICLVCIYFIWKKLIRPCVLEDPKIFEEQPMREGYDDDTDCLFDS